jgi:hypothetical protein
MNEPTQLQLRAMTDDELAQYGWRRNDKNGLTRLTRGELLGSKKGFGFVSFVKAMMGGTACATLQYERMKVCNACQEVDSKGERLYRIIRETAYCGIPRNLEHLADLYRDEVKDGCGCSLMLKVSKYESDCPLKKWPEKAAIRPAPIPASTQPAVKLVITKKPCGCGKGKRP